MDKIVARGSETIVFMWVRKVKSGKFFYTINREHPLVRDILSEAGPSRKAARALLRLLEETVPVPQSSLMALKSLNSMLSRSNPRPRMMSGR